MCYWKWWLHNLNKYTIQQLNRKEYISIDIILIYRSIPDFDSGFEEVMKMW